MTRAQSLSMSNSITAAVKDIYANWFKSGMGDQMQTGVPRGLVAMGRVPADEAWVYTCVDILSSNASGVPFRVQVRQGKEWVDNEEVNDRAAQDYQFLLDDVNPEWEGAQLQLYLEAADDVHGGSYIRKVRGRLGGQPKELWWLNAEEVEPKKGRTLVERYEYRPGGTAAAETYYPRDIIAFGRFNLKDPTAIVSPLEAARFDIAVLRRTAEWNANLIGNYGIPPGAWVADKESDFAPTELNAIKRALRAIRGQGGAGKIPVLPGGLTWVPLSMTQKDADWLGSGKVSRMTVCAILGVPLVLAGDDEKSGVYAGARDAERIMWRKTLIPKLDRRAARFDSFLTPEFDKTRKHLRVAYDYSGIEALKAPPAEEMQAWAQFLDRGLPLNRAIDYFRMGLPIEGGDEPRWNGQSAEEKEKAQEAKAEARIRPEAYQVNTGQGRESVRSLGKRLYKHPAVRAWIDRGDVSGLTELVDPEEMPVLIEGLRQRHSADQIHAALEN